MTTIWLAYRVSHQYGGALEDTTLDLEHIVDADTDALALTKRLNEYHALPETIHMERGGQFVIPAFATRSNTVSRGGGGCFYDAHYELRKAPRVGER